MPFTALSQVNPWAGLVALAGIVVVAIYRLKREKIRADRDKALAELALKDAKPSERGRIIESLAKTKQFGRISLPLSRGFGVHEASQDETA